MSLSAIKLATEAGSKIRLKLNSKQLALMPEVQKFIKNIEKPEIILGINGRGAEGSIYGIKVLTRGKKEPVAYAAGRVDFRDPQPVLQARFAVQANTGGGVASKGRVMFDTNHKLDLNDLEELTFSTKKGQINLKAKSSGIDAEATGDLNKIAELMELIIPGVKKHSDKCTTELNSKVLSKLQAALKELNFHNSPVKKAKLDKSVQPHLFTVDPETLRDAYKKMDDVKDIIQNIKNGAGGSY